MNVIIAYLETMFSAHPASARMREARAELQTMMEDAYTAAISEGLSENEAVGKVITEFGNLDELAPALGISSEVNPQLLAGDTPASAPQSAPADASPVHPPVEMSEARAYGEVRQHTQLMLATAVSFFVLAPAPLVALAALSDASWFRLSDGQATLVGLFSLLALVAAGVLILVRRQAHFAPLSRIVGLEFSTTPAVTKWASELATEHARERSTRLQVSILLWIFAFAPIMGTIMLPGEWSGVAVAAALLLVAAGLFVLIPGLWAANVAEMFSGRAGVDADEEEHSIIGVIASFYWPLLTAIYLAWSFIGNDWGTSWIIWPVGAILFGAIAAGGGALENFRKSRS